MAHPVATLFALSMAVWVADARLTPVIAPSPATATASCQSGPSTAAPADADVEVVVCASRK